MDRIGCSVLVTFLMASQLILSSQAQPEATKTGNGLEISLWAKEPMLKNPVALSFDDNGQLYVVETARRSTVDIDIRAHKEWIVEDLANQSVDDLRRFFRRKMASELSDQNKSWLKDLNQDGTHDWRDLMEIKERVHLLEDSNGDGQADKAQVFYEGFNEEINGVIAGVMPNGEDVLVTVYPDLWRLRDIDGDGIADEKESLFRGFGVHAAFDGHDIHGLTWGPDGKIYFSVGDNGFSVTNKEGRKLHYPNTGGVLRMNPDYSDLEVFAYGLRNVQEIAFDKYGNLFSVDNDGDLEDERERFVYITEGSDSGWRLNWQFRTKGWAKFTEQPDYNPWIAGGMWKPHFKGQPAHITPPLSNYSVGPGGFKYNPGTALNERYKDFFFCVQFPVKKITAFKAQPKGAYFEMIDEHVFHSGLMASAVNFSPNGGIYIADWDGMWSPNEKGAIYQMDDPSLTSHPIRQQVKQILNEGTAGFSSEELISFLGHGDQRVRLQAQYELARRKETSLLLDVATDSQANQLARIHALWGIGQNKGSGIPSLDKKLPFGDQDPEIQAQSAKIAGDLRLKEATESLVELLRHPSPRVKFFAALSLGKTGDTSAVAPLLTLLEDNNEEDAYIRHASVMGLSGIGNIQALAATSKHSSKAVRIGAVLALRRLKSSSIIDFLSDSDIEVQREAVSAIHDDFSIPDALPSLAAKLSTSDLPDDEAIVRRAISANLRLGREENAQRLIRYARDSSHSNIMRVEALDSLADWNNNPFVDRVEGRVRKLSPPIPGLGDELLTLHLPDLLADSNESISGAASKIANERDLGVNDDTFTAWARSSKRSTAIRSEALRRLDKRNAQNLDSIINEILASDVHKLKVTAWEIMAKRKTQPFLNEMNQQFWNLSLEEQQGNLQILSSLKFPEAKKLIENALDKLMDGKLPKEIQLDVILAAKERTESSIINQLKSYESSLNENDSLAPYRPALFGGNANIGQDIYSNHVAAQCVRCHNGGGEGNQVGPPLDGIGSRVNREYILQALVDPSATIASGYEMMSLELESGEVIAGRMGSESKTHITIQDAAGGLTKINKGNIVEKNQIGASSMPPMGLLLAPNELRDLVEYLADLK